MEHRNVNITGIGTYHPTKVMKNDYYIDHFKKLDIDVSKMLNNLGRETRLQADPDMNAIDMALQASEKALEDAGITADMLDMILFVSETPEFTSPTNALKLHHFLKAKNAHITYDMNGCCTGMITAIDQVSRNMRTNPSLRYALVVGTLLITPHATEKDPMFYATFGDASAAIILENKIEGSPRGFIDSQYITNSDYHYTVHIPVCGFSQIHRDDVADELKMAGNVPFDFSFLADEWSKAITTLLDRNQLGLRDVDHLIFSQFSRAAIHDTSEKMGFSLDKTTFIGDQYGYTGSSSPVIALKHALEDKKIVPGSKVVLISIGSGYNISAVLYQF